MEDFIPDDITEFVSSRMKSSKYKDRPIFIKQYMDVYFVYVQYHNGWILVGEVDEHHNVKRARAPLYVDKDKIDTYSYSDIEEPTHSSSIADRIPLP